MGRRAGPIGSGRRGQPRFRSSLPVRRGALSPGPGMTPSSRARPRRWSARLPQRPGAVAPVSLQLDPAAHTRCGVGCQRDEAGGWSLCRADQGSDAVVSGWPAGHPDCPQARRVGGRSPGPLRLESAEISSRRWVCPVQRPAGPGRRVGADGGPGSSAASLRRSGSTPSRLAAAAGGSREGLRAPAGPEAGKTPDLVCLPRCRGCVSRLAARHFGGLPLARGVQGHRRAGGQGCTGQGWESPVCRDSVAPCSSSASSFTDGWASRP